ncbi:putative ribonuclease H-like domain-containing protein [Tanacetum coccineum]|uniref:Ribonuclease H-like domain-containing protein n=1 Tax=Tanacetum coccineum TaxID=301880 RepID=A0ABQ5IW87_9ASTR
MMICLLNNINKIEAATYKEKTENTVEAQLVTYRKNEVLFSEEVVVLKREVGIKQYEINMLKIEFEKVKKEKDGIEFKIEKFDKASKDLDQLLESQITDKKPEFKGYGLENSKKESTVVYEKESDNSKENSDKSLVNKQESQVKISFVEGCVSNTSKNVSEVEPKKVRKNNDAPIIEDWVSDDEEQDESMTKPEKKTAIPTAAKIEKPVKKSVRPRIVNTARSYRTPINTVRPRVVNTARSNRTSVIAVRVNRFNVVNPSACTPQRDDKGFIDSRCSRHMTGNIDYLSDFKQFDGGYVAFGGGAYGGKISSKEKKAFRENISIVGLLIKGVTERRNRHSLAAKQDTSYFDSPTKNVDNGEPKTTDDAQKQDEDVNTASPDVNTGSLKLNVVGPSIEPTSIAKALSDSSWVEAMQEELLQFKLQQVLILVDLPNGKKSIGTKWVFRNKKDKRGIVIRNKSSAFLYGTIEEEVYVTQPLRFKDPDHPDKVYKVVKALYGLHQAPRACQDKYVAEILKKFNYSDVKSASTPVDLEKPLSRMEMLLLLIKPKYVAVAVAIGKVLWIQNIARLWAENYYCKANVNAVKRTWAPKLQLFSNSYHLRHCLRGGISQEVGTPRYLSLVVPLTKVGDEVVHKELGDRMERATTTASSLEAEQDNEKPEESDGFAEIIDFLKASSVSYALTVNPVIYTSCIEQFWATAKVPQDEEEHEESVPTPSNDPQPSGEDSMATTTLKKRNPEVRKEENIKTYRLKRLRKVGMSQRVESSEDRKVGCFLKSIQTGRVIARYWGSVVSITPAENKEKKEEVREETTKGSRKKMLGRKRAGKEQQKESLKKQKVEEEKESGEVEEDDKVELKKLLVIKKDEDIAIDAIPLATKLPVIIDYKLHKEEMLVHYELIRADGSSKRYSSMIRMLQRIYKEDLEALWRIVKAKYGDTRPKDEFERVLYGDLRVMFKPDIKSDV